MTKLSLCYIYISQILSLSLLSSNPHLSPFPLFLILDMKISEIFTLISFFVFYCILGSGVHVLIMQDCCIGTYMAVCFASFLPFTHICHFSPGYPSPPPRHRWPSPFPPYRPQCLEIPHILTHRRVMKNENTWTQGEEY